MSDLRALIGRVAPCGCPVRVKLIAPDDTPLSVEQARGLMRAQGLRTQIVDGPRLMVTPVVCLHGPRRTPSFFALTRPRPLPVIISLSVVERADEAWDFGSWVRGAA